MILKCPNVDPFKFFFLSKGMADTLLSSSIPLQDVCKLHVYHGKLTYQEIAHILKFQQVAAHFVGVESDNPFGDAKPDIHNNLILDVFNSIGSEALRDTFIKANKFQYLKVGNTILMVVGNHEDNDLPGWHVPKGNTLGTVLLKTIYEQVGYLDVHSGPIVQPKLGEFTLAEVFKLIDIQNP